VSLGPAPRYRRARRPRQGCLICVRLAAAALRFVPWPVPSVVLMASPRPAAQVLPPPAAGSCRPSEIQVYAVTPGVACADHEQTRPQGQTSDLRLSSPSLHRLQERLSNMCPIPCQQPRPAQLQLNGPTPSSDVAAYWLAHCQHAVKCGSCRPVQKPVLR
jgi:hypothetical protein